MHYSPIDRLRYMSSNSLRYVLGPTFVNCISLRKKSKSFKLNETIIQLFVFFKLKIMINLKSKNDSYCQVFVILAVLTDGDFKILQLKP